MSIVSKLQSVINFTKNIATTGAVAQTGKNVERQVCSKIDDSCKVIVEFGAGYGNITERILNKMPSDCKLYSFEVQQEFADAMKSNIKDSRLQIIVDRAENFTQYIDQEVDCFISTIPMTFLSKEAKKKLISDSYDALAPGRYFCNAQYSKIHMKKFQSVYDHCTSQIVMDIPPVHVYFCHKN